MGRSLACQAVYLNLEPESGEGVGILGEAATGDVSD